MKSKLFVYTIDLQSYITRINEVQYEGYTLDDVNKGVITEISFIMGEPISPSQIVSVLNELVDNIQISKQDMAEEIFEQAAKRTNQ